MKAKIILLSTITATVLSISVVHAAAGSSVAHNHNSRSHSHPLPATGKNHTHGQATPAKVKKPSITHTHDGRSHTHILPASGKNHSHGKKVAPRTKSKRTSTVRDWFFVGSVTDEALGKSTVVNYKLSNNRKEKGKIIGLFSWVRTPYKGANPSTEISYGAVNIADCRAGFGIYYNKELGDSKFTKLSSWAKGSGTLGSKIATDLCSLVAITN